MRGLVLSQVQEEGLKRAFARKAILSPREQQGLANLLNISEEKVEHWFRERREERQATIDVVDIESEEEEDNNKEDNTKEDNTKEGISDDEEKVPVVKLQKTKTQVE